MVGVVVDVVGVVEVVVVVDDDCVVDDFDVVVLMKVVVGVDGVDSVVDPVTVTWHVDVMVFPLSEVTFTW